MVIYISKSNINNILRVKSKSASNLMSSLFIAFCLVTSMNY